jgi:D-alanyl-D-alanine carboxypeptidase
MAGTAQGSAEALLTVEVDSGKVLHAENATYPWYPASLTKLMTAYVALSAVRDGRISLDRLLTVSPEALAEQPSKMGFGVGTQVTLDNALKMLMVKSANDMAVVIAEGVSGSVDAFAADMNLHAQRLGMTQTHYRNPNGLPDEAQVTSARDQAILARALIREFPEHEFYWRIPAIRFGRRVMRNHNALIDRYPGADGMKTGFICASGFNVVATATRGQRRLIAVVLGAPSSPVRAVKAAQLLENGFTNGTPMWLMPALGTVHNLMPIAAAPIDLRDTMCGKNRRRPAAEEVDEAVAGDDTQTGNGMTLAHGRPVKPSTLLGPWTPSEPVLVYVGSSPRQPQEEQLAVKPKPAKKKKSKSAKAKPDTTGTAGTGADAKPASAAKPRAKAKPARAAGGKPAAKSAAKQKQAPQPQSASSAAASKRTQ